MMMLRYVPFRAASRRDATPRFALLRNSTQRTKFISRAVAQRCSRFRIATYRNAR